MQYVWLLNNLRMPTKIEELDFLFSLTYLNLDNHMCCGYGLSADLGHKAIINKFQIINIIQTKFFDQMTENVHENYLLG